MRYLPKGSKRGYSGSFERWALFNNITDTVITGVISDGDAVAGLSMFLAEDTEWSCLIEGKKDGRAILTVTATSPGQGDVEVESILITVRDKQLLRSEVFKYA